MNNLITRNIIHLSFLFSHYLFSRFLLFFLGEELCYFTNSFSAWHVYLFALSILSPDRKIRERENREERRQAIGERERESTLHFHYTTRRSLYPVFFHEECVCSRRPPVKWMDVCCLFRRLQTPKSSGL